MTGLTEISWILMFAFAFSGCDNVLHVASENMTVHFERMKVKMANKVLVLQMEL